MPGLGSKSPSSFTGQILILSWLLLLQAGTLHGTMFLLLLTCTPFISLKFSEIY
jgi:hypothetical protein